jgi:hypothetical protein
VDPDPAKIGDKIWYPTVAPKEELAAIAERALIEEADWQDEEDWIAEETIGTLPALSDGMFSGETTNPAADFSIPDPKYRCRVRAGIKKEKVIYPTKDAEASSCQMSKHDKRASKRLTYDAPVTIENCDTGEYFYGRMYNYSLGGMYFETDYPLQPGTEIRVAIRKSANGPGFEHFRAKVRWCEEISEAVVLYDYAVGVQYAFAFSHPKKSKKLRVIQGGTREAND